MPNEKPKDLSAVLSEPRIDVQRKVSDGIACLKSVAVQFGLKDTAAALSDTGRGLESDNFNVIVMGRFKNGKSTLVNALMGGTTKPVDLSGAHGLMAVDDLPATAVLSAVTYADTPFVKVWKMDGQSEAWPLSRYLRESALGDDDIENVRRFQGIREFEIGFPARLCESKVTLYDSPGQDEKDIRTVLTREAAKRCDAAVMVYSSNAPMGEQELKEDAHVRANGTRVFVVVNLFGSRQVDERLRGYVWNRYVRDYLQGASWAGQDLGDYDIFFVNALMASDGRYGGSEEAYRNSGLAAFEQRLGEFLINDRLRTHLAKFTTAAVNLSNGISQQISQRQAAMGADRDRLRAAWEAEQSKLTALRSRPDRLGKIIERYCSEATAELSSSFTEMVAGIRADLPGYLESARLPSGDTTFKVMHQRQLMAEAVIAINGFINVRITEWSEHEADGYLRGLVGRLTDEVRDEVADIGRRLDAINMALTGWDQPALGKPGALIGTTERVVAAIAGFLLGDLSAAIGGGAGGWRGATGGVVGAFGASWLLIGVLGITSGFVLVPILAAAALAAALAGSAGLVNRIKQKALEAALEKLATLPAETAARIASDLKDRFGELGTVVWNEVTHFVEEQLRNVQAQVELNELDRVAKERMLQELDRAEADVNRQRDVLKNALTVARQV